MMKPVNQCLYVKPDEPIEMKQGIIMPMTNMRQTRGVVRASDSSLCKVGDHVIYARFFPVEVDGEDLISVHEKELIGVDAEYVAPAPAAPLPPIIMPKPGLILS